MRQVAAAQMASRNHLEITASEPRVDDYRAAAVIKSLDISHSVKLLRIRPKDRVLATGTSAEATSTSGRLHYRGGQWIDMDIPGVQIVGGFSFVSSPNLPAELADKLEAPCEEQSCFDIAVRKANHPPARWVHESATTGSRVSVRVGGDFTLDRVLAKPDTRHVLFIAGGVGINPLYSMLLDLAGQVSHGWRQTAFAQAGMHEPPSVTFLYSCRTPADFLFSKQLGLLASAPSNLGLPLSVRVHRTATRATDAGLRTINGATEQTWDANVVHRGRITPELLAEALGGHALQHTAAALCGPPAMTDSLAVTLQSLGLHAQDIHYEKWW